MPVSIENLDTVASNAALLGYALASIFYLIALQKTERQPNIRRLAFGLFVLATLAASVALAAIVKEATVATMSAVLLTTLLSWLAIGGHLQFNMRLLGAFVAPLCTLILLVKFFLAPGRSTGSSGADLSLLASVHVLLAVLGQAFAIIACAVSVFYLWQQNLLKKKLIAQLGQNGPAIDRTQRLLVLSLWSGFVFLTLGLITGAFYTQIHPPPPEMRLTIKVIWAILVWVWYLAILLGRNVWSWSARRIARLSLAGFLLLAVSYFGMGFFKS